MATFSSKCDQSGVKDTYGRTGANPINRTDRSGMVLDTNLDRPPRTPSAPPSPATQERVGGFFQMVGGVASIALGVTVAPWFPPLTVPLAAVFMAHGGDQISTGGHRLYYGTPETSLIEDTLGRRTEHAIEYTELAFSLWNLWRAWRAWRCPRTMPPAGQRGIWDIASDLERGAAAEARLGGRTGLHFQFPVIDRFENGVATSVKTMDLARPSYQNIQQIVSTGQRQIDQVPPSPGLVL